MRLVARALLIAVLASVAATASPARAAESSLTFTPGQGLDTTPVRVYTSAPCPAQTQYMVALAFGHGFGTAGQVVITTNQINFSTVHPFSVPLQDTMRGFAADVGTTLQGTYRLELRCTDQYENTVYRSFEGSLAFSDARHWSAPEPSHALMARMSAPGPGNFDAGNFGVAPNDYPVPDQRVTEPSHARGQSSAKASAAPHGRLPAVGSAALPEGARPQGGSRSWAWWLLPLGGGLVLLAGGLRALRRPATAEPSLSTDPSGPVATHSKSRT